VAITSTPAFVEAEVNAARHKLMESGQAGGKMVVRI